LLDPDTTEAYILENISNEKFEIVQSDYLIEEVLLWFRRKFGKDFSGKMWHYLNTIPNAVIVSKYEWALYFDDIKDLIEDNDDIPHICSYLSSNSDCFVTINRKLAQMKVSKIVNFLTPDDMKKKINQVITHN